MYLQLAPATPISVTPLELLEDFADSHREWSFLEDDSTHYSRVRGLPGCVLRYCDTSGCDDVELAFATVDPHGASAVRLLVIDAGTSQHMEDAEHHAIVDRFLSAFRHYMNGREHLVAIDAGGPPVPA